MENKNQLLIPGAIVVAGLFIALAIFFSGGGANLPTGGTQDGGSDFGNNNSGSASSIRAVDENDHIFGNPDAPVTIVEFSDYECPFCSRLHPTLERIVAESDGEVRWVYRHFPLNSIHPQATPAAIAAECVARLGGNDAFWDFSQTLFDNQRALGSSLYVREAIALGIDEATFNSCLNDASVVQRVQQDFDEAVAAGGRGTPFSVIVSASGEFFPFSGALPYEQLAPIVEEAKAN